MTTAKYQRLGYATELSSLLFRYRLAKYLVVGSLLCILLMAISTLLYPRSGWLYFASKSKVSDVPRNISCVLPSDGLILKSPDGSYTPPSPDATLFLALEQASDYDYNSYCERWDPERGFPDETEYNANGECGTWQSDYIAFHEKRLQDLERIKAGDLSGFDPQNRPKFVAYLCEEDPRSRQSRSCGGLADRMSGMISIFFYALLTDRAYLAHWHETAPIPLETLFEKPHINWSYEPAETKALFDKNNELLSYEQINTLNVKWGPIGRLLFPDGPEQDFKNLWNASFLEWRSNRAFIIRTFQESSIYPSMLEKVGLTKENAFYCLTDFLFRPTFGSRQFISAYKHLFQMDSILSIGLQIRTGDQDIINPGMDDNTLEKWNYFWKCANELREYARKPHHTHVVYFLITDSAKLRDEFVSMNQDEDKARSILGENYKDVTMVVTGLPIQHIEAKAIKNKYIHHKTVDEDQEQMIAGVNSAVIENWILSFTDYRLISRQGFGKLAAFHSQSATTTISMPMFDDREGTQFCGDPDAFVTFDELSVWWSLG